MIIGMCIGVYRNASIDSPASMVPTVNDALYVNSGFLPSTEPTTLPNLSPPYSQQLTNMPINDARVPVRSWVSKAYIVMANDARVLVSHGVPRPI